jgi:hypothetical protein
MWQSALRADKSSLTGVMRILGVRVFPLDMEENGNVLEHGSGVPMFKPFILSERNASSHKCV